MEKQKLNSRCIRKLEILLALSGLAFYVLCLASVNAFAGDASQMAKGQMRNPQTLAPERNNGDYLNHVPGAPVKQSSLNNAIFDKTIAAEMTEKYNSFNAAYEQKQAYRLNRIEDYINYQKANQDLVEWTVKKLLQYHFENTLKNQVEQSARRAVSESHSKEGRAAASAVVAISNVHKAINNSTFQLSENTKTKFKYDFPSGQMRVGLTGPFVDANVDYRLKPVDPDQRVGVVEQPEKLGLGLSKSFRSLAASSSVHYAVQHQTLNYGMNKHLMGPVSAQVEQVHGVADSSKDETLYRVNVGMSF